MSVPIQKQIPKVTISVPEVSNLGRGRRNAETEKKIREVVNQVTRERSESSE